jgi:hypothetical protein
MRADKFEKDDNGHVELTGTVIQKKFAPGSKSEHDAIYIETDHGDFRLRRLGGNPFSDPELKKLVGKKIIATGMLNEKLFVANTLKDID